MPRSQSERRRQHGVTVNLLSTNTALGWHVVRQVSAAYALEQIALRKWREIWCESGELFGVQPMRAVDRLGLAQWQIERLLAVTITNAELRRYVGLYGKSRTLGMPEWKRLKRHGRFDEEKILAPEDAIERAIEKVRRWPFCANVIGHDEKGAPIWGDKAIRVYPRATNVGSTRNG